MYVDYLNETGDFTDKKRRLDTPVDLLDIIKQ